MIGDPKLYGVTWEHAWIKTAAAPLPDIPDYRIVVELGPIQATIPFLIDAINEPGGGLDGLATDMIMMSDLERRVAA